jgi:hypothetical protein
MAEKGKGRVRKMWPSRGPCKHVRTHHVTREHEDGWDHTRLGRIQVACISRSTPPFPPTLSTVGHDAVRGLQLAPHVTGLDTACVYGRMLSAAVVPPLHELAEARGDPGSADDFRGEVVSGQLAAKLAAGSPISRQDLGVRIVSVPTQSMYSAPGGRG